MSSSEVAQGAPAVGDAPEGAKSPVADVQEVATAATEEAPEAQDKPEKAEKSKAEKRLAEIAYEAREAKRKLAAEAEARAALERELEAVRAGKGAAPKAEDFDSYEAYLDARADWLVEQKLQTQTKKQAEEQQKAKQIEEQTRKHARLESVVTAGRDDYKDFDATLQVLDSTIANPDDFRVGLDEILDSDHATEILYYLGKNPSLAVELAALPANKQAKAIGALEERFKSKKLTAAPAPVEPLKGNGGRVTSDRPPKDPAEYRKWRAKNLKR